MESRKSTRSRDGWAAAALAAILLLPALPAQKSAAKPAAGTLADRIRAALAASRPVLLDKLARANGGELALLCLAAVHDAVPAGDKVFAAALKKLARARLGRTYDVSLRLMVASECPALPNREALAAADTRRLLRALCKGRGFGYSARPKWWDLSNTQYGALGLRAAIRMGQEVPPQVWRGILQAAVSAQDPSNGGFGYREGGRGTTVSMTAAGIAVMQLCADHLDGKVAARFGVQRRLGAAWNYLADHKGEIGNRTTRNSFYFHYGLERACILSEVTDIDGKDWYAAGAEMLLRTQLGRGGWRSTVDHIQGGPDADGSDAVSTSFAILFLRRKFQKTTHPITPSRGFAIAGLTEQSASDDVVRAVAAALRSGHAALPGVLRGLRSPIKPRRIAAAKALIGITGQDFGFNPHVPPERSGDAASKAELWWLKNKDRGAKGKDGGR